MVSDTYRKIEDITGQALILHDDLLKELENKLNQDRPILEQAVYRTCITTSLRPIDVAHVLNEFHMHLRDVIHGPKEEEENG